MKHFSQKTFIILSSILVSSCQSQAPRSVESQSPVVLKSYEEVRLDNGLRILFVEDKALPRVGFEMMFLVGSLHDPSGSPGLNYLTAALLDKGTAKHSATAYADEMGQIASDLGVSPGVDFTNVSASTLSSEKKQCLDLFTEAILSPAFSDAEIEREKKKILAEIQERVDNPSHFIEEKTDETLFGDHPYAHPVFGDAKSISSLSKGDLVRQFFKYYRPNNALLAVTGDFDASFKEQVKKSFSGWQAKDLAPLTFPQLREANNSEVVLFSKPDLKQTQIRIVSRGIKRADPDYLKLKIANAILGGEFVSRLNLKIRDELGLTYSISSGFDSKLDYGKFEISTFTRNDKVVEVLKNVKLVVSEFVNKGITDEELKAAKSILIGQFPSNIETTDKLAFNLQVLRRYGLSDDYLRNFKLELSSITKDQVNEALRKHLHPENLLTVLYADQMQVLADLQKLGPVRIH
jgi:zinc protease